MEPETVETLFARFVAHADPALLAEVFDRTAPKLLDVALHLAGNPVDAEDLLQATFTSAMTWARKWDGTRPLLPWLLGILANHARTARRRERRAALPERLLPKPALDPACIAEHRELVQALEEKVSHLPERYRSVLVLYLRHGLTPSEIAEALQRAPATVRSQLMRGLELLRKALPVGLAGILVTAIAPTRGLAAVRTAVLECAPTANPVLLASLAGKTLMLLLGVPLVLALGSFAWSAGHADEPSMEARIADASAPAAHAADTPGPVALDRVPVLATQAATGSLLVQVTFGGDGSLGAQVGLQVRPLDLPDAILRDRWYVTRGDGSALIDGLTPGKHELTLDRAGTTVCEIAADKRTNVALVIPKGIDVSGRAIDQEGAPVTDAAIWLSAAGSLDHGYEITRSGANGLFRVRDVGPDRAIAAYSKHHCVGVYLRVAGEPGTAAEHDLKVVRAVSFVTAIVVDPEGKPLENACAMFGSTQPAFMPGLFAGQLSSPPRWARANAAGMIRIDGIIGLEGAMWKNRLWVGAAGFERRLLEPDIPSSGAHLGVITLQPAAVIRGRVLGVDGKPAANAAITVECELFHGQLGRSTLQAPAWVPTRLTADAQGRFVFEGLPATKLRLDSFGREFFHEELSPRTGETIERDFKLTPGAPLRCILVDQNDRPRPALAVIALPALGQRFRKRATSDADGRFTLEGCLEAEYTLSVLDAKSAWSSPIYVAKLRPAEAEQRVHVPDSVLANAAISGVVLDHQGTPLGKCQMIISRQSDRDHGSGKTLETDKTTGAFRFAPTPSGRFRVSLYAPGYSWMELPTFELKPHEDLDLGNLRYVQHGLLAGTVLGVDGKPVGDARGSLLALTGGQSHPITVNNGAIAEPCPAPPGRYHVYLVSRPDRSLAQAEIEVRGGAETRVALQMQRAVDRIIRATRAEPGSESWFTVQVRERGGAAWSFRGAFALGSTSSIDAHHTWTFLPGSYVLEVEDDLGRKGTATLTIDEVGTKGPPIVITLR